MREDQKRKNNRDLLKGVGIAVLAAAVIAALVVGSRQLGIR